MFHRARTRVKTKAEEQAVKVNGNKVVLCHCSLSDNSCVPVDSDMIWSAPWYPREYQFSLCSFETNDFIQSISFLRQER